MMLSALFFYLFSIMCIGAAFMVLTLGLVFMAMRHGLALRGARSGRDLGTLTRKQHRERHLRFGKLAIGCVVVGFIGGAVTTTLWQGREPITTFHGLLGSPWRRLKVSGRYSIARRWRRGCPRSDNSSNVMSVVMRNNASNKGRIIRTIIAEIL